jgi:hypothetical protein
LKLTNVRAERFHLKLKTGPICLSIRL